MDLARLIFEILDKMTYKSYNESVVIEGAEKIKILLDKKYSLTKKFNCNMDLFYNDTIKEKMPVVIYIHGGGFVAGGKEYRKAISLWYATKGFFVVNANYGLSPDCIFPEQIKQLVKILNWIQKNEEKYNLDLNKIVVAGDSAGAYFSAMLACVCGSKVLQKKLGVSTDLKLCATILNCGLYDLKTILNKKIAFGLNEKIFESYTGTKKSDIENYKYKNCCSPLSLINKSFPPTFLIYAEKDVFCAGQSELLAEKFKSKDIYFEKVYSKSAFANHCFSLEWKKKHSEMVMLLQEQFLEKIKRGKLQKKLSKATELIDVSK